jgi:hypothetical protein
MPAKSKVGAGDDQPAVAGVLQVGEDAGSGASAATMRAPRRGVRHDPGLGVRLRIGEVDESG